MWKKFKDLLAREILYLILAPTLIMAGIVLYGIFIDTWYKDYYNIMVASVLVYVLSIVLRLLFWISGKIK